MAAALRVQYGPGWTTPILNNLGIQSSICDDFTNRRKRKHDKDSARKILLKYKKQRLMTRYGQPTINSSPDTSYGSDPAEPDVSVDELKRLCQEYLARLQVGNKTYNIVIHYYPQVSNKEICQISIRTVDQGDDHSGEWIVQRRGRVTASSFGEIVKRRLEYAPLVIKLLYSKSHTTKAMRYGHDNEPNARELYLKYLQKHHHNTATVQKTGFHIDFQVLTQVVEYGARGLASHPS